MQAIRTPFVVMLAALLCGCAGMDTRPSAEARAALAPSGTLRVGVYLGNPLSALRDSQTQELKGAGVELGQALARRMDVPFEPIVYPSVGALLEGAKSKQWDVALFQVNPARAREFDFTPPIVEIELGYLVAGDSRLTLAAHADADGVRIAVQEKSSTDTTLTRQLTRATIVRVSGLSVAAEAMKAGKADAIATIKPSLFELSKQLPGSRVLDGRFAQEHIAMAIPKGRDAGAAYARTFVEEAKAQGVVSAAVERSGARGAIVAPPQGNR